MIDLKPSCAAMVALVGGVTDDQLTAPTPCVHYTVGELLQHVAQVSRGATALAREDPEGMAAARSDGGDLGPGWKGRVERAVTELGEAWDDPMAWTGTGNVAGSDLSNETWGKIALTELVVHGWDLARATGQPYDLPDPTLEACLAHVAEFVPDAPVPEIWGPPVAVPADAPRLDRIVAITGRTP